jgi:hypothetical protein
MRRWSWISVTLLACLIASCSFTPGRIDGLPPGVTNASQDTGACAGQTPPPTATPAATAAPSGAQGKTRISGLIDLGQVSADDMRVPPYNTLYYVCLRQAAISGIVVNDTWSALQPDQAGETIKTASIDRALAAIRRYNANGRHPLGVRLRIWAGMNAPVWAKSIGGPPVSICDGTAAPTPSPSPSAARPAVTAAPTPCPSVALRSVGRFWSDAYARAWRDLQRQLASKYDGDALIEEVSVSSCSSLTSEPFVQPEDDYSKQNLQAAGYTDARYQHCLANAIGKDYASWRQTLLDYSFNPFREIDVTPPVTDLAFTETTIAACRAAIGSRCVLLNETMAKFTPPPSPAPSQSPSQAQGYYLMWNYMRAQGGAITFQTASPPNLLAAWGTNPAGWNAAVQLAHAFGASSLELFPPKNTGPCTTPPQRLWISGYTCFRRATLLGWKKTIVQ